MTAGASRAALCAVLLVLSGAAMMSDGRALAAPDPIPAPPIPAPPQLGPTPRAALPPMIPAPRPDIEMPAPPAFDRMAIPPVAAITPAAKDDPVPPQLSGTQTAPPPTTSPGANDSQIEEVLFAVEPGTARIPASAEARLQAIARDMASDPAARLEIRTFSPTRAHSESTARRLSLARFLAIRDSLKRQGVDEGRVDGRPLASTPDELNADRVELYVEH